jgi:hypothetical protein
MSSSAAAAASVMTASLCLRDQSRAREERDPIEFSFHDFDFLLCCCFEFIFPSA